MATFNALMRLMALSHLMLAALLVTAPGASALGPCAKSCYEKLSKRFGGTVQSLCHDGGVPEALALQCEVRCITRIWDATKDPKPCDYYGTGGDKHVSQEDEEASEDLKLRDVVGSDAANSEFEAAPKINLRRSTPARQKRRAIVSANKEKIESQKSHSDDQLTSADASQIGNLDSALEKRMPGGKDPKWAVNSCGPPGETCAGKPGGGTKRDVGNQDETEHSPASATIKPGPTLVGRVASQRPAFTFVPTMCTTPGIPCGAGKIKEREAEDDSSAIAQQARSPAEKRHPASRRLKKIGSSFKATDPETPKPALCGFPGMTCSTGAGKAIKRRDPELTVGTFVDDDGNAFEVDVEADQASGA